MFQKVSCEVLLEAAIQQVGWAVRSISPVNATTHVAARFNARDILAVGLVYSVVRGVGGVVVHTNGREVAAIELQTIVAVASRTVRYKVGRGAVNLVGDAGCEGREVSETCAAGVSNRAQERPLQISAATNVGKALVSWQRTGSGTGGELTIARKDDSAARRCVCCAVGSAGIDWIGRDQASVGSTRPFAIGQIAIVRVRGDRRHVAVAEEEIADGISGGFDSADFFAGANGADAIALRSACQPLGTLDAGQPPTSGLLVPGKPAKPMGCQLLLVEGGTGMV